MIEQVAAMVPCFLYFAHPNFLHTLNYLITPGQTLLFLMSNH